MIQEELVNFFLLSLTWLVLGAAAAIEKTCFMNVATTLQVCPQTGGSETNFRFFSGFQSYSKSWCSLANVGQPFWCSTIQIPRTN